MRFFLLLVLLASASFSQAIPRGQYTTLTDQQISIPKPSGEKPLLLILSFSHQGGDDVDRWTKRSKPRYAQDERVDFYILADFQGVPSLILKMIMHGLRRSVPEPERSHFAPFYADENLWKKLVGFDDPKIAYVVLANPNGSVVWQTRGPSSDALTVEVENAIVKLRPNP